MRQQVILAIRAATALLGLLAGLALLTLLGLELLLLAQQVAPQYAPPARVPAPPLARHVYAGGMLLYLGAMLRAGASAYVGLNLDPDAPPPSAFRRRWLLRTSARPPWILLVAAGVGLIAYSRTVGDTGGAAAWSTSGTEGVREFGTGCVILALLLWESHFARDDIALLQRMED